MKEPSIEDCSVDEHKEESSNTMNEPQNVISAQEMDNQEEELNDEAPIAYEDEAESIIYESPGELQHGAAIVTSSEAGPVSQEQTQERTDDTSTIASSQQAEIMLDGGEEQSVDLSSIGMASVVSRNTKWEDHPILPPSALRKSQQRHYAWNPSSSRGRSTRWQDSLHLMAVRQPPLQQTAVQEQQEEYDMEVATQEQQQEEEQSTTSSSSNKAIKSTDANNNNASTTLGPPSITSPFTLLGAPDSKYTTYHVVVDSSQEDCAVEIQLGSMARPHMRAFHLAWMAFFVAFFTWFSLTPLLSEIAISLSLNKEQIWTSSILGVAGSAVTRILIGPVCDRYGARWAMAATLFLSAIPMALTGLVQTGVGLSVLRLFIGLAGSAFVTSQYWTSSMFTREVAGTANALVAGWGNLGGGVTQLVMGSLVFPLLKIAYGGDGWSRAESTAEESTYDRASDLAWRTSCVIPAVMCLVMTYFVIWKADDCPKGNYSKRNREGHMHSVPAITSMVAGSRNPNTLILFIQYGCSFGVEITMINAAALYFKEEFHLSTELSAAVASIFGWMNLFARGLGGFLSDIFNAKLGMRGRLWLQLIFLFAEGALVVVFSKTLTLGGAIVAMIAFSTFVQAAEGSTYAIVPYLNPSATGSIAGLVGAGGNVGGVLFAILFREYDYRVAFSGMGWAAMISALLTIPIAIPGHASLFCGSDAPEVLERRTAHMEEMGNIPPVILQHDDHSSVKDRDTSRRSRRVSVDLGSNPHQHGS